MLALGVVVAHHAQNPVVALAVRNRLHLLRKLVRPTIQRVMRQAHQHAVQPRARLQRVGLLCRPRAHLRHRARNRRGAHPRQRILKHLESRSTPAVTHMRLHRQAPQRHVVRARVVPAHRKLTSPRAVRTRQRAPHAVIPVAAQVPRRIQSPVQQVHLQLRPRRLHHGLAHVRQRAYLARRPTTGRRHTCIHIVLVRCLQRAHRIRRQHQGARHRVPTPLYVGRRRRDRRRRHSRDHRRADCLVHIRLRHRLQRHARRQHLVLHRSQLHRPTSRRHHPVLPVRRPIAQVKHRGVIRPRRRCPGIRHQRNRQATVAPQRNGRRAGRHHRTASRRKRTPTHNYTALRRHTVRAINRVGHRSKRHLPLSRHPQCNRHQEPHQDPPSPSHPHTLSNRNPSRASLSVIPAGDLLLANTQCGRAAANPANAQRPPSAKCSTVNPCPSASPRTSSSLTASAPGIWTPSTTPGLTPSKSLPHVITSTSPTATPFARSPTGSAPTPCPPPCICRSTTKPTRSAGRATRNPPSISSPRTNAIASPPWTKPSAPSKPPNRSPFVPASSISASRTIAGPPRPSISPSPPSSTSKPLPPRWACSFSLRTSTTL